MNIETEKPRLALLIDADNISAKYLPVILNEIPRYGISTYRRIYGDFTDPQAASWRRELLDHNITPVQQFSNVKDRRRGERCGKNATDSTLIIDAMDILYAGQVDGFVIVSSDSDFTRLASRLRESNMTVIGMGRNHTSVSFRHACTKFVNIEMLYEMESGDGGRGDVAGEAATGGGVSDDRNEPAGEDGPEATLTLDEVESVVAGIIRSNENDGRPTPLSTVGDSLNVKFPDFDVRSFGYSQLSKLIEEMDRFELVKVKESGYDVKLAASKVDLGDIFDFIAEQLDAHKGKRMSLAPLATKVYARFPDFKLKDAGYSQFYKFVNSSPRFTVTGTGPRKQVRPAR